MRELILENRIFNIPESWDEITLQNQIDLEDFMIDNPDWKNYALLIYLGLTFDEIKHLKFDTVVEFRVKKLFLQS